jgi:hypothetical protein
MVSWQGLFFHCLTGLIEQLAQRRERRPGISLATSPEVEGVSGKYFVKKKATPSAKQMYNELSLNDYGK